jgi:hypothetical protein
MEDSRAAMEPSCHYNPRRVAVRVSGGVPDDNADATVDGRNYCDVVIGRDDDGTTEEFGSSGELDGVAEEVDMGLVEEADTRMLELGLLRR